ncbi:MAG: rhamnosidase [Verrucomicrobiaceae bacterium]|nr:MAG: rhamnosidase [Verrucomicrobiaceae bacterium]
MSPSKTLFLLFPLALIHLGYSTAGATNPSGETGIEHLRCEYRIDPVGIDVVQPRLSWTLASGRLGEKQTAFQILVASSPEMLAKDEGDLWDSGKVPLDQTTHVVYAGKPLESRMRAWWKVRAWDMDGQPSAWSAPASWTMGLLQPSDWQAKWIADPTNALKPPARKEGKNGCHSMMAKSADRSQSVTVDLGKPQSFDAVRLFPARPYDFHPDTPGFLFPVRFKIEAASRADFSDTRVILDHTDDDEANPGTNPALYRFPATTAQFVRLTVTRLGQKGKNNFAFALAEMQVLNGDRNLAQGAPVSAPDSLETGTWSAANLTDGVLVSVKPGNESSEPLPATMFRRSFELDRTIRRATAYVTALGLYELRLNGQRVGDHLLAPEWTSYRKRLQYQVFDVTALLHPGENAVAAYLGEGWYAGRLQSGRYGTQPRFLLQLEVEFADGGKQTIVTDESWLCTSDGPIRSSGIYDGEVYDARKEAPGWDTLGFNDKAWQPVQSSDVDSLKFVWQRNEPIQVEKEITPVRMTEPKPGVFVFDFGQNMVGWVRVKAMGAADQTVTLRHGEMLNEDGTIFTGNLRRALQTDRYTPRTDGEFVFEPHFTYHGFRFLEVTGLAQPPTTNSVLGRVFHSSAPIISRFECSDPSLNQLMQNILWTQRANLMGVPTDCPQRGERLGWLGDIQAFAQTAIFNMDMAAFLSKSVQDIRDDQADDGRFPNVAPFPGDSNIPNTGVPAWGDAGTIIPWLVYENYGDTRLLQEHFEAARRWVDFIHKANPGLIWANNRGADFNDWLNGDKVKLAGWPNQGGSVPKEVFATAFFAHSTELVAKMAAAIGRKEEARYYGELFENIKTAFNQSFVKPDGRIEGDTQGGYALALSFNLLPDDLRPKATAHLVENIRRYQNHLSTGIQTTHHAMLELMRNNQPAVAWQLLTNRTFPSWLYMIDNGATTIWERWDGYVKGRGFQDAGMNSFNHWALGAVGEWMWRNIAGFNPDENQPGWKHFVIAPKPGGGVTWAKSEYQSIHGAIQCDWKIENGKLTLRATVPPNTTATICVPTTDAAKITESGKQVSPASTTSDTAVFEVESGSYEFVSPFSR